MTEKELEHANGMGLDVTVASSSATWHTILDIVGNLLTNRCQVKKLLFYRRIVGCFGKLPKLCRFVPKIISPVHVIRITSKCSDGRLLSTQDQLLSGITSTIDQSSSFISLRPRAREARTRYCPGT
jgi:hypothetical protein